MPDLRRRNCRCCGKHESEVGPISWQGNCRKCGHILLDENIDGIHERKGYAHKRRLRGIARYVERALVDDTPANA